jgi:hypothetical protein
MDQRHSRIQGDPRQLQNRSRAPRPGQPDFDSGELDRLRIEHPNIEVADAIKLALTLRLDYQNARDTLEDSTRKVDVAADGLKPRLDFVSSVGINSAPSRAACSPPLIRNAIIGTRA